MSRFDDARRPSRLARALSDVLRRLSRARLSRARLSRATAQRPESQTVRVEFEGLASGTAPTGCKLLSTAIELGVDLSHYCGGSCSCGTCRVEVLSGAENLSAPRGNETMVLGAEQHKAGDRLACQARVLGPVVVRVPRWF